LALQGGDDGVGLALPAAALSGLLLLACWLCCASTCWRSSCTSKTVSCRTSQHRGSSVSSMQMGCRAIWQHCRSLESLSGHHLGLLLLSKYAPPESSADKVGPAVAAQHLLAVCHQLQGRDCSGSGTRCRQAAAQQQIAPAGHALSCVRTDAVLLFTQCITCLLFVKAQGWCTCCDTIHHMLQL
jgi:hypothetical protein